MMTMEMIMDGSRASRDVYKDVLVENNGLFSVTSIRGPESFILCKDGRLYDTTMGGNPRKVADTTAPRGNSNEYKKQLGKWPGWFKSEEQARNMAKKAGLNLQ